MKRYNFLSIPLILSVLLAPSLITPVLCQAIDMRWDFVMPKNVMGWTASEDVTGFAARVGGLTGTATGSDPKLISPEFKLTPTNEQIVEIAMLSDKEGTAKLYWANTKEAPSGGFRPEKVLEFKLAGDKKLQVYRLAPFWKKEGQIIKLRIDPPSGAKFLVDYVRIRKTPYMPAATDPVWDFSLSVNSWLAVRGAEDQGVDGRTRVFAVEPGGLLLSPPMNLSTRQNGWVMVQMKASAGSNASVVWVTDQEAGSHTTLFPVIADDQVHTYNVELSRDPKYQGALVRLGLIPSDQTGEVRIKTVAVGNRPLGPAEVMIKSVDTADPIVRSGAETKLTTTLKNMGGHEAKELSVKLTLPSSIQLKSGEATRTHPVLAPGKETKLEWTILPSGAGEAQVDIEVTGKDIPIAKKTIKLSVAEPEKKPG